MKTPKYTPDMERGLGWGSGRGEYYSIEDVNLYLFIM